MPNRPIPVSEANVMIESYLSYMTVHGVDTKFQTHNIGFSSNELLVWMTKLKDRTDEFRICLGVYPQGHQHAGKLTTIIWPYKDGRPVKKPTEGKDGDDTFEDPFNEGELRP